MALSKSYVSRIFLLCEILVFLGIYFFGVDGIAKLCNLRDENIKLEHEIVELQRDVANLDHEIAGWNSDPFYKEKVAREQLQMARKDEEILFVK